MKETTSEPVSKRQFGINVKHQFEINTENIRLDNSRVKGYNGLRLRKEDEGQYTVASNQVANIGNNHCLVPTGDIKDGTPVTFLIHTTAEHTSLSLNGKSVPFKDINVSPDTPLPVLQQILTKIKLCKGYEDSENPTPTIWSHISSPTVFKRTISTNCHLVLPFEKQLCKSCRNSKQYQTTQNKENIIPNSSPSLKQPPQPISPDISTSSSTTSSTTPQPLPEHTEPSPHKVPPKLSHAESVADLAEVLHTIGIGTEKALLLAESIQNDVIADKRQRRWSERYVS